MADRPSTKFTDAANIPNYLQKHGKFCLWKYEQNKGRWTKVPYQPKATQYKTSSTNVAHFTDLQTAMAAQKGFDGVGLGIFGDICAVDLDHVVSDTGELSQLAQTVIQIMDSYTEYSPSGKGIRIIFRAAGVKYNKDAYYINNQDARDPRQNWPEKQGLEVYVAGITNKYVTITGNTIKSVEVAERSTQIKQILDRYMKKKTATAAPASAPSVVSLSDRDLIETAKRARNGVQFSRLYEDGDISAYPSHSEADQALFNLLAFYTAGDADRMIQLFKASALYRADKSGGEKYLERTAQKAIKDCTTYYTPTQTKTAPAKMAPATKTAEAVKKEEQQKPVPATTVEAVDAFLSKARSRDFEPIPTGYTSIDKAIGGGFIRQTIALLGAAPGAGKTIFAQQIFENIAKEGRANVLYYNLEMSVEQLIARSLSRDTEYTPLQILQGYNWTPQQEPVILEAAERYKKEIAPRVKYNPCISADYQQILESMEREAKALEKSGDNLPLVVVVDYLQLLQGESKDDVETIKAAVKGFKDFAIKYDAVVFVIMAHSRATNKSGEVTQGAGRDTSAIEYAADLQLSLNYADESGKALNEDGLRKMYEQKSEFLEAGRKTDAAKIESHRRLTVTKNRFGQDRSAAVLNFWGEHSKFTERAPKGMEEPRSKWNYKAERI